MPGCSSDAAKGQGMSREIVQELTFFAHSLLMGLIITFAYDWIRMLRRLFRHGVALTSLEDLLFWLACGIAVFYMLYRENNGTLRWFSALAAALGMLFYKFVVRDSFVDIMSTCIHKMLCSLICLIQIVLKPVKRLFCAGKTCVLPLAKNTKKCKKWMKNRLTGCVKTVRMILCKR